MADPEPWDQLQLFGDFAGGDNGQLEIVSGSQRAELRHGEGPAPAVTEPRSVDQHLDRLDAGPSRPGHLHGMRRARCCNEIAGPRGREQLHERYGHDAGTVLLHRVPPCARGALGARARISSDRFDRLDDRPDLGFVDDCRDVPSTHLPRSVQPGRRVYQDRDAGGEAGSRAAERASRSSPPQDDPCRS